MRELKKAPMSARDKAAKEVLINMLIDEGYPRYARLLQYFSINIIASPDTVGYTEADRAVICINNDLSWDGCSVVVRHEILHQFFEHATRALKFAAKKLGYPQSKIDDIENASVEDRAELETFVYADPDRISNIAGDLDISNLGYTEKDKATIATLTCWGRVVQGLVTDTYRPEFLNLTYEEMYEKLYEEQQAQEIHNGPGPKPPGPGTTLDEDSISYRHGRFIDDRHFELDDGEMRSL